ncbi:MAG TPA: hypothetical protein VFF54_06650 [Thermodesulfobacteriota bacterium]|nr:hypothetical protein [Thermodesulfobacteriota bacterium]
MIRSVFKIRYNGFFVVLAIIVMAFGVIGCGKKTLPRPPDEVSFSG